MPEIAGEFKEVRGRKQGEKTERDTERSQASQPHRPSCLKSQQTSKRYETGLGRTAEGMASKKKVSPSNEMMKRNRLAISRKLASFVSATQILLIGVLLLCRSSTIEA